MGVTRPSLLGDIVASLVTSNLLSFRFPEIHQATYIDKKCAQIAPLLLNHQHIKEIRLSEKPDEFSAADQEYFNRYAYWLHPFVPVQNDKYYNNHSLHLELLVMNRDMEGRGLGIGLATWRDKDLSDLAPRLTQWFPVERHKHTIALWPFAGYTKDASIDLRSPKKEFYEDLCRDLMANGFHIKQYGHPLSEKLKSPYYCEIEDRRQLNLFDAVKESLGADLIIGTDSGASHIFGAYGMRQIVLYTNYLPGHTENVGAMLPINYNKNMLAIYGNGGINNITREEIIAGAKQILK